MVCITHTLGCNQIKLRPKLMFWWNVTLTLHWAVCHSVTAPPGMGRIGRIIVGPGCGCSFLLREGGQWTLPGSWHLHYIAHTLHPTIATLPTLHVSLIRYYNIKLLFDGTVLNIKPEVQWEQALLLFISAHIQFCMMTGQTYHELYCWWLHIQNLKCWLMLAANVIM